MARDFPGEKPLYYSKNNTGFIYSSEVKAMEAVLEDLTLDRQALWDFPSFLWIPEPATAYEEINSHYNDYVLDEDQRISLLWEQNNNLSDIINE